MKRLYTTLFATLLGLTSYIAFAGAKADYKTEEDNLFNPSINSLIHITDKNGAVNVKSILNLNVGNHVQITFMDGNKVVCLVKTIQLENDKIFKVFGDVIDNDNAVFGFAISSDAQIGGAVIFKDKDTTYKLKHVEADNKFYLVPELKIRG